MTIPQIAGVIDLLPTLTQMAGIPVVGRKPLDGRDLSPLLLGEAPNWTDPGGSVSVRTQQYRLGPTGALFDMRSDATAHAAWRLGSWRDSG